MATGMLIDGIAASEAIDSSGEILDVDGCDISSLEAGDGVLNWEHRDENSPGASPSDVVGKIIFAKKVFKRSDAENDRQRKFWDEVKLPYIYIVGRLYDGAGHQGAKDLAAQIRDHHANNEPINVRFSVEGSTLLKEGDRLVRSVARRVATTIKPCNKSAVSGLVEDPNAPEGFEKKPVTEIKDILADVTKKEHSHPLYTRLGGHESMGSPLLEDLESVRIINLYKSVLKKKLVEKQLREGQLAKAYTAGMGGGAPGTLTGGAALQREHFSRRAKAVARDFDYDRYSKAEFTKFLKHKLPEADDGFIDHFAGLVDHYRMKKAEETLVYKMESWSIDLRKAADEMSQVPKPIMYGGKKVYPGKAVVPHTGQEYTILGEAGPHWIGVPSEHAGDIQEKHLVKLPKKTPQTKLTMVVPLKSMRDQTTLDADMHSLPGYANSHEQRGLFHGVDTNKWSAEEPGHAVTGQGEWVKAGDGGLAYTKTVNARHEGTFHDVARDFFGLGHHVPTTAVYRDPRDNEIVSIQKGVPGASHSQYKFDRKTKRQVPVGKAANVLGRLGDAGELDKLAMMDGVMGNWDRHDSNYVLSDQEPGLHLIDNGGILGDDREFYRPTAYLNDYANMRHSQLPKPLESSPHPQSMQWALGLNPEHLAKQMQDHGVAPHRIQQTMKRLMMLQHKIKHNPTNLTRSFLNRMGSDWTGES